MAQEMVKTRLRVFGTCTSVQIRKLPTKFKVFIRSTIKVIMKQAKNFNPPYFTYRIKLTYRLPNTIATFGYGYTLPTDAFFLMELFFMNNRTFNEHRNFERFFLKNNKVMGNLTVGTQINPVEHTLVVD